MRTSHVASLCIGLLSMTIAPVPAESQWQGASGTTAVRGATSPPPDAQRVDSARNLRVAKSAVRHYWNVADTFWVVHRQPAAALVAHCGHQIGRYCYGADNGGLIFGGRNTLPVEFMFADFSVMRIKRRAMARLYSDVIRALDRAQDAAPGDRWIMGQRVLQRVERAELDDAARVADRCRSDRWWCAALVGYTKHLLGLDVIADSAFDVALATMPERMRCEWEDLGRLVEGDGQRGWYTGLDCAGRIAVNRTIWWLADPLYLQPGNERRTAHYFRVVHAALSRDGEARLKPHVETIPDEQWRLPHGPSFESALIRLGIPAFMALGAGSEPMIGSSAPKVPRLILQYRSPSYHFIPSLSAARAPLSARADDWDPFAENPAEQVWLRSGSFSQPDYQLAWFRRGDSARVVATLDIPRDTLLTTAALVGGGLVLSSSASESPRIATEPIPTSAWTFAANAPADSVIVSLEAMAPGVGSGRVRLASGPPPMPAQRVSLSDVLVLDSPDSLPSNLDQATRRAARTTRLPRGGSIGLYWELYGLRAGDTSAVTLAVIAQPSRMERIARRLGFGERSDRTLVGWTEVHSGPDGITGRSLALDLRTLAGGDYVIELEVAVLGQRPVMVRRQLEIVPS